MSQVHPRVGGETMRLRQWPLDEWLPIAEAMDRLFEAAGWLKG